MTNHLKLLDVRPSTRPGKKYMATFETDGKHIVRHFGASGYDDYIKSGSEKKKNSYIARHGATESFKDATAPSTLARFLLWNKPTLSASIADFKERFNL